MIQLISPAKTLDFKSNIPFKEFTLPMFSKEARILVSELKKYTPADLMKIMEISHQLAELNFQRFLTWTEEHSISNSRQAIFAYNGDVYAGLDAFSLQPVDFEYAQNNLLIISGLYGILRPLDLIQPYRLEMGTKLTNTLIPNLYTFWQKVVNEYISKAINNQKTKCIINLASNEYFNVIDAKLLNTRIITPMFKEFKNGKYMFISVFGKKARGLMSRFIIKNRIENSEDLKSFDYEGYSYSDRLSGEDNWLFVR